MPRGPAARANNNAWVHAMYLNQGYLRKPRTDPHGHARVQLQNPGGSQSIGAGEIAFIMSAALVGSLSDGRVVDITTPFGFCQLASG